MSSSPLSTEHNLLNGRKFLIAVLAIVVFVSAVTFFFNNDESDADGEYFVYNVNGVNTAFIVLDSSEHTVAIGNGVNCAISTTTEGEYAIPSTVVYEGESYNVVKINTNAFIGCGDLTKVTIPASVEIIGGSAFNRCVGLSEVIFEGESSLKEISSFAFNNCDALSTFTIPEGTKTIGISAFTMCTSLESVSIASTVTALGASAFSYCENLQTVTFEGTSKLTSLGAQCFMNCGELTAITIPSGVTVIPERCFENCKKLVDVDLHDDITTFGHKAFHECNVMILKSMPKNIETIEMEAFSKCNAVVITELHNVKYLGNHAFNCTATVNVAIPETVTVIPYGLFWGCVELESVTLPDSLVVIGAEAFSDCAKLKEITIPENVTKIEQDTFHYCLALEKVTFLGDITQIGTMAFDQCKNLSDIQIPETVTDIAENAFKDCTNLEKITIGSNTTISLSTFNYNFYDRSGIITDVENIKGYSFELRLVDGRQVYQKVHNITLKVEETPLGEPFVVIDGEVLNEPDLEKRTGYNIKWYTDSNTEWNFNDKVTESLTITAKYVPIQYTIKIHSNEGGEDADRDYLATYDVPIEVTLFNFDWHGRVFQGYSLVRNGEVDFAVGGVVLNLTDVESEVIHLYASWRLSKYTVVFNSNGENSVTQEFEYGVKKPLLPLAYTNEGHKFFLWVGEDEYETVYWDCAEVVNLADEDGAIVNLHAVWYKENNYVGTYDGRPHLASIDVEHPTFNRYKLYYGDVPLNQDNYTWAGKTENEASSLSKTDAGEHTIYYYLGIGEYFKTGSLTIDMAPLPLTVTVHGNVLNSVYDGATHTVSGYTLSYASTLYNDSMVNYTGNSFVSHINRGTHPMNISIGDFNNTDSNFDVTFVLGNDGYLYIGQNTISESDFEVNLDQEDYTGNPIEKQITATLSADDYEVEYANNTQVGKATIIITGTGNYVGTLVYQFNIVSVVTFNTNFGDVPAPIRIEYGGTILPISLSDDKYTLNGWYVSDPNDLYDFESPIYNSFELTALWVPTEFTITYDLNGGENDTSNPPVYTYESGKITLADATRKGYTFLGWYKDSVPFTEIIAESYGNLTLVAMWELTQFSIIYELDGGTNNDSNPSTYNMLDSDIILHDAAREGFSFEGWYLDSVFTNPIDKIESGSTENITIYAKWSAISYTITYNLLGGTNAAGNPESYTILSETIDLAKATRKGYTFLGWYDNDTSVIITQIESGSHKNISLTAQWETIEYPITYVLDKGNFTVTYEESYNIESETITLKSPVKEAYRFVAWYTTASLKEDSVISTIESGSTGPVVVYAKWTPSIYTIYYFIDGEAVVDGVIQPSRYAITSESLIFGKTVTREGYSLDGWYSDPEMSLKTEGISAGSHGNIRVYAKWVPIKYTIHFDKNSEFATGSIADMIVEYDGTFEFPNTGFDLGGYHIVDWLTSPGGESASSNNHTMVDGATVTLYAKWEANNYTVKFNSNDSYAQSNTQSFTYDSPEKLNVNEFINGDSKFLGWNTSKDAKGDWYANEESISGLTTEYDGVVNLYAIWVKEVDYEGTYDGTSHAAVIDTIGPLCYYSAVQLDGSNYKTEGDVNPQYFKDCGEYTIYYCISGGDKCFIFGDLHVKIVKAEIIVKITGNHAEYTYDSQEHTVSGVIFTTDSANYDVSKSSYGEETLIARTYAGTSMMDIDPTKAVNTDTNFIVHYELESKGYLQINKAEITVKIIGNHNAFVFDGTEHEVSGYEIEASVDYYVKGDINCSNSAEVKLTAVGKKIMGLTLADFSNGNGNFEVTFEVEDGYITVSSMLLNGTQFTVNEDDELYSGFAIEKIIESSLIINTDYTVDYVNNLNVGTATITITGMGNYGGELIYEFKILAVVTFNSVHGEVPAAENIEYNSTVSEPSVSEDGYAFMGWYVDSEEKYDFSNKVTESFTLTAKWELVEFTITYIGGENASNPGTYTIESADITFNDAAKKGYEFDGWFDSSDNKIDRIASGSTGDITVYAKFTAIEYLITYMLDGGNNSGSNPESYTIEDEIIFANPDRADYVFIAWYVDATMTQKIESLYVGTTGDLTVYARWYVFAVDGDSYSTDDKDIIEYIQDKGVVIDLLPDTQITIPKESLRDALNGADTLEVSVVRAVINGMEAVIVKVLVNGEIYTGKIGTGLEISVKLDDSELIDLSKTLLSYEVDADGNIIKESELNVSYSDNTLSMVVPYASEWVILNPEEYDSDSGFSLDNYDRDFMVVVILVLLIAFMLLNMARPKKH